MAIRGLVRTYSFVLLVKVVHVAIENLDKELDGDGGVHTCVGNSESPLQAFQDTLAVAIQLEHPVSADDGQQKHLNNDQKDNSRLCCPPRVLPRFQSPTTDDLPSTQLGIGRASSITYCHAGRIW